MVARDYRGRDKMNLQEFIEDVEKCHFRTGHDTGANHNALFVWNILRQYAGLEELTRDDLIKRHADDKGWTFEEMKEDYRQFDEWYRSK
jgi:hypothetical protein